MSLGSGLVRCATDRGGGPRSTSGDGGHPPACGGRRGGRHHRGADAAPRDEGEYQDLLPLLLRYGELEACDPRRRELLNKLVSGYLPVAINIARRYAHRGESFDDLTQVATLGLILAVERFRQEVGSDFLAFAIPTIQGEVRKYFRDRGWAMRVPRRLKDINTQIHAAVAELSQRLGRAPRPSEIAQWLDVAEGEVLAALEAAWAYRPRSLHEPLSGSTAW